MTVELDLVDGVALVTMRDGENRFRPTSLQRWHEILDRLESLDGPLALVVTGEEKFFSNGVDIDAITDPAELAHTVGELRRLLARLLVLPAYSVCAINGHAYGAGAVFTCALDYRVMRYDRGYWCVNEAAIGLTLDEGLAGLVLHRLDQATGYDAILCATRYDGPGAVATGIIEHAADADQLLNVAVDRARQALDLDRQTLGHHKRLVHGSIAQLLTQG